MRAVFSTFAEVTLTAPTTNYHSPECIRPTMSKRKIENLWIIDDDPMSSFYIKRLAELGEFARIITIYDKAKWAIKYLLEHRNSVVHLPDVILLDIYMPEMDGWTFLEEFSQIKAELEKNIDIYIISSSNHTHDLNKARMIPEVKAYLQKPITKNHMKEIVNDRSFNSN